MQEAQAPLMWRRSTACLNAACVEVAEGPVSIFVRDSKIETGPVLAFCRADWTAFIDAIRRGLTQRR